MRENNAIECALRSVPSVVDLCHMFHINCVPVRPFFCIRYLR
jgi:hypothetical protein